MKRILPFSIVLIATLILGACGSAASTEAPIMADQEMGYAPMPEALPTMYTEEFAESAPGSGGGGDSRAANVERIVIQNADLSIVVADVEVRMQEIQEMAQEMGGFVVSSSLYQGYTSNYTPVPEASITIRVPSEDLDEALEKIKEDVVDVQNETRSGQDVTAEYVDLKSRLKTYQAAEQELTKLMQSAADTDEVVNIFNQLMYYREQIEIIQGQIKYYEEAAALSAISIRIIAEETIQPIEIGGWEPQGVARDAIQDLIYFWQNFVDFLIRFVIYTLPVWITIGIPLYLAFLGVRWVFRKVRGNKKKVEPQEKKEEEKSK
jgi:predicted DNA binding CopG/RHH family protein